MKILIIHGQSHEGSTCAVARELAEKIGGETKEFFLPKDFDRHCLGCYTCFNTELSHCPHYKELEPLVKAIMSAELLIFASPVYVYHATGSMKSFLDHLGTWWMVHRPVPEMSRKQAVAICTAAGGGMKSTDKDMTDSLKMWGVGRVYSLGFGVRALSPDQIPENIREKIHKKTSRLAKTVRKNQGKSVITLRGRFWFHMTRLMHKMWRDEKSPDYIYWEQHGWHGKARPWK